MEGPHADAEGASRTDSTERLVQQRVVDMPLDSAALTAAAPDPDANVMLSLLTEIQRVRSEIQDGLVDHEADGEAPEFNETQGSGDALASAGQPPAEDVTGELTEEHEPPQPEISEPEGDEDAVMFLLGQIQKLHASLDAPDSADVPRLQRLLRNVGSSSSLASLAEDDLPFPSRDPLQNGTELVNASFSEGEEPTEECAPADSAANHRAADEGFAQKVSGDEHSMLHLLAEVQKLQGTLHYEHAEIDVPDFEATGAASDAPTNDVSSQVMHSEAGANQRGIKRSMSFDTQAQVDALVSEAGSLLERLTSSDARDISNLLHDMSGSNMLAAILSSELQGMDGGEGAEEGEETAPASGEAPMASSSHLLDSLARKSSSSGESGPQTMKEAICAVATESGVGQTQHFESETKSVAPLRRQGSLTTMFTALKVEGAVVQTALGKNGSFVVNDTEQDWITDEGSLASVLEGKRSISPQLQPAIGRVSSLNRVMGEFRTQAAEVRRAISVENLGDLCGFLLGGCDDDEAGAPPDHSDCRNAPGLAAAAGAEQDDQMAMSSKLESLVFPEIEYDSWDDVSSDEESSAYVTPKRAVFIQGLKVLRMMTLNAQANFFCLWRSSLAADVQQQVEAHTEEVWPGSDACGVKDVQEAGVVQVALPQSVKQTWPDLDVDGYHAATVPTDASNGS